MRVLANADGTLCVHSFEYSKAAGLFSGEVTYPGICLSNINLFSNIDITYLYVKITMK
jgi:hypothetical protein